jgi:broad specificity phosphatase PhoE
MLQQTTISLVRHGEIENPGAVYQGRLPGFPLSERGRRQAAAAADHLRHTDVTTIYASPMQRAQETAYILQQALQPPPPLQVALLLNEVYSPFDGQPRAVMETRGWDLYTGVGPGYEQPKDVLARVLTFFDHVRQEHAGEHVVGVTHADLLAFVWLWALRQPVTPANRRRLRDFGVEDNYPATASISTFVFPERGSEARPSASYVRPYGSD